MRATLALNGLSQFREHKFNHSSPNSLYSTFGCGFDIESMCHYLLHCPNFVNESSILLDTLSSINADILSHNDNYIVNFSSC